MWINVLIMNSINFNNRNPDSHQCEGKQFGDTYVFTCPLCPKYRREFNSKTGDMTVEHGYDLPYNWESMGQLDRAAFMDEQPSHHGFAIKAGLDVEYNPN